jgi:zinc transport system permease protein
MIEYLTELPTSGTLLRALAAGLLASMACGVVGTYVVVRRITYIAGGITHCVLGGIGAAIYLRKVHGWDFLEPIHGATVAALLAAAVIGLVSLRLKQREDTIISALWAMGMATGILFIELTPGYAADLMGYLFGDIALVSLSSLYLLVGLNVLVVGLALLFYKQFLAVCYDEQFARARGVNVEAFYMLLLGLTALTVVLVTTVVGILLVIALLTIPVAVASFFGRRLWHVMLLAAGLSCFFTILGQAMAYRPGWPTGATIVLLAGGAYLILTAANVFARRTA